MTVSVEFFCNFCNRSAQRREPGDEPNTGYVRLVGADATELPHGWEHATYDGVPGAHRCPSCVQEHDAAVPPPTTVPEPTPAHGWPALASPFSATTEGVTRG